MTEQEIFNKVWHHLNKQGRQAGGAYACMYRTPTGGACAAGCLVDDATAAILDAQADTSIGGIFRGNSNLIPAELRPHVDFLVRLQFAHDRSGKTRPWLEDWRAKMRDIAKTRNLTVPSLEIA